MKQRALKTLLFLFVITCFCSLLFVSASAAEVVSGDFVFTVDGANATLKEYTGSDADVKIPSKVGSAKVTAIGNEAFWGKKDMKTVTIPTTVKVIGTAAFNECTSLTKVNVPYSVTAMGDAVFWYCTSLKQVFIPKNTTVIGDNVFVGCHSDLTVYVVKDSYGEKHVSALKDVDMAYRYITSLKLSSTSEKLAVGDSLTLTRTVSPEKVYNSSVTYASSNTKVATVSSKGKVTAVGIGSATITCTAKDGSKLSATCKITVVPDKVTGFTVKDVTPEGYTLCWDEAENATGYRVYKYNSSTKKYESYKNTADNYITVSGLKVGSYQYYKVASYAYAGGTYYFADKSATYKVYTAKPGKVTAITAKPAHNYINLSWSATDYATGYKLYFYNKETSKYTYIGSTVKTSYKVSSLSPDTGYTFMVRAYLKYNGTTLNASYSPLTDAFTRPDYVSGLSVKENSVYTSRVTLEWDLLEGAAGYLVSCDDGEGNYVTVATVNDPSVSFCRIENLKPGTEYLFKIKAFSENSGKVLYGYNTKTALSVTTNNRPADGNEGFKDFVEAYNTTKSSDEGSAIISIFETSDFVGENRESYESVVTASQLNGTVYSYITEGTDKSEILGCTKDDIQLSTDDAEITYFDEDGNGYRIEFTLRGQQAASQLFGGADWKKVSDGNADFVLTEESFSEAKVSAKVQNGRIDDITVTVPVTVSFTLGAQEYSFTQTYTATYLFIR